MNEEIKSMTDHFCATLESETEKHAAILAETTRGLMSNSKKSYKDALLDNLSAPPNVDPRILAREGIKAQQILFNLPANSETRELNQSKFSQGSMRHWPMWAAMSKASSSGR